MISVDKIQKVEVLTPSDIRIISAPAKYFSIPSLKDNKTGQLENVLIIKGRGLPEVETDSIVYVVAYFYTGKRMKFQGRVKISTDLQLNVALKTSQSETLAERRQYYKVQTNIVCVVSGIVRGTERVMLEAPVVGRVTDLNIGGIFLCAPQLTLDKGDIVSVSLNILEKRVDVMAQILRVQKNPAGDITGYGCKFLNVSPQVEEIFAKYVYQAQRQALD